VRAPAGAAITDLGDPLGFPVDLPAGRGVQRGADDVEVIRVEARQLVGHQKEALVVDGDGVAWRLSSDEGSYLDGTDLAPFPLGFFSAGLVSDLHGTLERLARARGLMVSQVRLRLSTHYWLAGSFRSGSAEGHAETPDIRIDVTSPEALPDLQQLVRDAVAAAPGLALLRRPMAEGTFALHLNGRRRPVEDVPESPVVDVRDPLRSHGSPPRPGRATARHDVIEKTDRAERGAPQILPVTESGRRTFSVEGEGVLGADGLIECETWPVAPGASHFVLRSDESGTDRAPSGLALAAAGIAFCYMTQLARFIHGMGLPVRNARLVQFLPVSGTADAPGPIDTHLFLDGAAPEDAHRRLISVAARTCYLHATARAALEPRIELQVRGGPVGP